MTLVAALTISLTIAMACIVVLRIYGDWLRINAAVDHGSCDDLEPVKDNLQGWMVRHLSGAGLAIVLLFALKSMPNHLSDILEHLNAAYALISLLLAATEMVLSQRLEAARVIITRRR